MERHCDFPRAEQLFSDGALTYVLLWAMVGSSIGTVVGSVVGIVRNGGAHGAPE